MPRLVVGAAWDGARIGADEAVTLTVDESADEWIVTVEAPFHNDPPPCAAPGPLDGLWEYEVVELFVCGDDAAPTYTEIEVGPHGHYLVLQLRGVRNVIARMLPIRYDARVRGARWSGVARIPRHLLPPPPHRINAYAIHGVGARRRYLAMNPVPGANPDFHRPDRFVPMGGTGT